MSIHTAVSARRRRVLGLLSLGAAVFMLVVGSTCPVVAVEPFALPDQITDQVGALDGSTTGVQEVLDALEAEHGIRMWVVVVDSYGGEDFDRWTDKAFDATGLHPDEALMSLAVDDGDAWVTYGYDIYDVLSLEDLEDIDAAYLSHLGDVPGAVIAAASTLADRLDERSAAADTLAESGEGGTFELVEQLTDRVGAVTGHEGEVQRALDTLRSEHGIRMWVVFVDSFDGRSPEAWADAAFAATGLGVRDYLLAVAMGDREYGYVVDEAFALDDDAVARVAAAAERHLAENPPRAVVVAAQALGAEMAGGPVTGDGDNQATETSDWWMFVFVGGGVLFVVARGVRRRQRGMPFFPPSSGADDRTDLFWSGSGSGGGGPGGTRGGSGTF